MADEQRMQWPRIDSVAKHLELAGRHVASQAAEDFSIDCWQQLTDGVGEKFESPLQAIFWVWFEAVMKSDSCMWSDWNRPDLSPECEVTCSSGRRYRLDFVMIFADPELHLLASDANFPDLRIAVELDGHDFHERTPEQVELRNRRDHDLMTDGWKVIHFSGREIHREPEDCVRRVLATLAQEYSPWIETLVKVARERRIQPRQTLPAHLRKKILGA